MSGFAIVFLLVTALALFLLPRRWAALPLLVGTCYMTLGQGFSVGPFTFTVIRVLALVGFIRVLIRGERPPGGLNRLDGFLLAWAIWALFSSVYHNPLGDALVFRLGLVYNTLGIYFLVRCLCHNLDDVFQLTRITAIILVPVAFEMVNEQLTGHNLFSALGGLPESVTLRAGRLRSQGPFAHAILAGTIGAVSLPLMVGLFRKHRISAVIGIVACTTIVISSASSGPLMSSVFGLFALAMWKWRRFTRQFQIAFIVVYLLLEAIMKAPPYYLIARIDLTGGSTGWHRARLIQSSIEHLDEWWWAGTDYTRHWMPTGVSWSPNHSDITNHYLQYGVIGGLPLMILFIAMLWTAFTFVGQATHDSDKNQFPNGFMIWCVGAALFCHATTSISVSYFDQSFLFLYTNLAMCSALAVTSSSDNLARFLAGSPVRQLPKTAIPPWQ